MPRDVDFKAVKRGRQKLDELARRYPELLTDELPEGNAQAWEQTMTKSNAERQKEWRQRRSDYAKAQRAAGKKLREVWIDSPLFDALADVDENIRASVMRSPGATTTATAGISEIFTDAALNYLIEGQREQGSSWREIADDLNARGIENPERKEWTPTNVRKRIKPA